MERPASPQESRCSNAEAQCPICLDDFRHVQPKTLHCGHSVCEKCVSKLLRTRRVHRFRNWCFGNPPYFLPNTVEPPSFSSGMSMSYGTGDPLSGAFTVTPFQQFGHGPANVFATHNLSGAGRGVSRSGRYESHIECPVCRRFTHLRDTDDGLPTNYALVQLLNSLESSTSTSGAQGQGPPSDSSNSSPNMGKCTACLANTPTEHLLHCIQCAQESVFWLKNAMCPLCAVRKHNGHRLFEIDALRRKHEATCQTVETLREECDAMITSSSHVATEFVQTVQMGCDALRYHCTRRFDQLRLALRQCADESGSPIDGDKLDEALAECKRIQQDCRAFNGTLVQVQSDAVKMVQGCMDGMIRHLSQDATAGSYRQDAVFLFSASQQSPSRQLQQQVAVSPDRQIQIPQPSEDLLMSSSVPQQQQQQLIGSALQHSNSGSNQCVIRRRKVNAARGRRGPVAIISLGSDQNPGPSSNSTNNTDMAASQQDNTSQSDQIATGVDCGHCEPGAEF